MPHWGSTVYSINCVSARSPVSSTTISRLPRRLRIYAFVWKKLRKCGNFQTSLFFLPKLLVPVQEKTDMETHLTLSKVLCPSHLNEDCLFTEEMRNTHWSARGLKNIQKNHFFEWTANTRNSPVTTGFHFLTIHQYYKMACLKAANLNLHPVAKQSLRVQLWTLFQVAIDPDKFPKKGIWKALLSSGW